MSCNKIKACQHVVYLYEKNEVKTQYWADWWD